MAINTDMASILDAVKIINGNAIAEEGTGVFDHEDKSDSPKRNTPGKRGRKLNINVINGAELGSQTRNIPKNKNKKGVSFDPSVKHTAPKGKMKPNKNTPSVKNTSAALFGAVDVADKPFEGCNTMDFDSLLPGMLAEPGVIVEAEEEEDVYKRRIEPLFEFDDDDDDDEPTDAGKTILSKSKANDLMNMALTM